jgi:MEDS: MEthanogen/methylotroph, DcmR Sensory domain
MAKINGTIQEILEQLRIAEYGAHYLIVYPDVTTLRELYVQYTKIQLEISNDIVVLIPYYETCDTVRRALTENGGNIDVQKYEKEDEGSLIILDSVKAYFGLGTKADLNKFIQNQVERAEKIGKNGVSVVTDVDSFHLFEIVDKLIEYELALPSRYAIRLKRFCIYDQNNFDKLAEQQKQKLLSHHTKSFIANSNLNK